MVKKVPKPTIAVKKTIKKAASNVQKSLVKDTKSQKLTNGYGKKKPETKSKKQETANDEEMSDNTESKSLAVETVSLETEKQEDAEMEELEQQNPPATTTVSPFSDSTAPKTRKRKAPVTTSENKAVAKTKTKKKQKVVYAMPEINSIVGKVFVTGDNSVGQLGFDCEEVMEKKRPTLIEIPYSIVDIAAGGMHSVCLTQTGEVLTFGCNDEGALGRETEEGTEYIPKKVEIAERIVQISAGDSHTAALSESGHVYIWGNFRNNNGVMGLLQEGMKQAFPVRIMNDVTVIKIASGSDHLSCLSNEGIVYTCGNGETGQLGRVSEHSSGTGGRKGMSLLLSPQKVSVTQSTSVHITDVWTSSLATFLKLNNGIIYAFGLNNFGQLGFNPDVRAIWKPKKIDSFNNKDWRLIDGGQHHTLALDNEGFVYSLGRSEYGRLGLGEINDAVSQPTIIPSLQQKKCSDISCGNCESFALEDNGAVYSWGFGTNYQLGHGNDSDQNVPKQIEGNFYTSFKALKMSGGGQHTMILAHPRNTSEEMQ